MAEFPRGVEVLIKKASVDPEFRALLLEKRSNAAKEIGLELSAAESTMIDTVPAAQLEAVINRTEVPKESRGAFLGHAAGAMLAALGMGGAGYCASFAYYYSLGKGSRPDIPIPAPKTAAAGGAVLGVAGYAAVQAVRKKQVTAAQKRLDEAQGAYGGSTPRSEITADLGIRPDDPNEKENG